MRREEARRGDNDPDVVELPVVGVEREAVGGKEAVPGVRTTR